ncbi:MAG: DNA cytosine methyltransferase, partial [Kiritimatiellae bacterium]|nr:DNA cytosine methyltransferase [Kiritimatiellia bacterium]
MPTSKRQYSYAELFAGCGGLSLGLESAGFRRVFANELSPMAAGTYVFNLDTSPSVGDHERFVRICKRKRRDDDPTKWQDDPRHYLADEPDQKFIARLGNMRGAMFVGGVDQLLAGLSQAKEDGSLDPAALDLDLLAGGPPCQSFSCAGRREAENPRNQLPYSLVRCAAILQPRLVTLENVSGILHPFTNGDGDLSHAWLDIAKAFYAVGYVPICTHSSAKHYGVPQSRPRFVMLAIRKDIAEAVQRGLSASPNWRPVLDLMAYAHAHLDNHSIQQTGRAHDSFRWIDASTRPNEWPGQLLPRQRTCPDAAAAIDDLPRQKTGRRPPRRSEYADYLALRLPVPGKKARRGPASASTVPNHEFREHCPRVRARFRVLRVLAKHGVTPWESKDLCCLPNHMKEYLMEQLLYFFEEDRYRRPQSKAELNALLAKLSSKKQSQKALRRHTPAPAQLTIPDDLVHYAEDRTLTVREMARFQSFPDDFEFVGKVTTGGLMRAYEVPQYTQVGNAVPPLLGRAIGEGAMKLLQA